MQPVIGGAPVFADLSQGLITNKTPIAYTSQAKPAKGALFIDPEYAALGVSCPIYRITDVANDWAGQTAIPVYPTVACWNCDESYMLLFVRYTSTNNYALMNGAPPYNFIRFINFSPADVEQWDWDPVDPQSFTYVNGSKLVKHNVLTDVETTIYTFLTGYTSPNWGDDPIFNSWNGQLFAFRSGAHMFSYRLGDSGPSPQVAMVNSSENSPEATASGNLLFWARNAGGFVYTPGSSAAAPTLVRAMTMTNTTEHGDLIVDANGLDVWAGISFSEGPGGSSGIQCEYLASGTIVTIIPDFPPSGSLLSGKATKNPGWVSWGCTDTPPLTQTYMGQEIMVGNVNSGKWGRVCRHRSYGENGGPQGYWAQPNITLSPRGTRIAFPSDWWGTTTVDTYVVHLPTYVP